MSEYTLYYLYKKQRRKSGDTSSDWEDVVPSVYSYNGDGTMTPQIKEENSTECGYNQSTEPMYKWENMDISTNWICDECGGTILIPTYRWVDFDTICSGGTLYNYQKRQESYNGGEQWVDVLPPQYQIGSAIESGSAVCDPNLKTLKYKTTEDNQLCWPMFNSSLIETAVIDGKVQKLSYPAMGYRFAKAGIHEVKIKFKDGLPNLDDCFYDARNLIEIPEDLFEGLTAVTSMNRTFRNASLVSLPSKLLAPLVSLKDLIQTFIKVDTLKNIPSDFFSNCPNVINFDSMSSIFEKCTSIEVIPSGLFNDCVLVSNFYNAFKDCTSLRIIPTYLFQYCTQVYDFTNTFYNCTSLVSQCPIDSDGEPIYKRSGAGKSGYRIVYNNDACFFNCTNMSNYSSIPWEWKN